MAGGKGVVTSVGAGLMDCILERICGAQRQSRRFTELEGSLPIAISERERARNSREGKLENVAGGLHTALCPGDATATDQNDAPGAPARQSFLKYVQLVSVPARLLKFRSRRRVSIPINEVDRPDQKQVRWNFVYQHLAFAVTLHRAGILPVDCH